MARQAQHMHWVATWFLLRIIRVCFIIKVSNLQKMHSMSKTVKALLTACALAAAAGAATAQEQVVNLYSARHYSTDEALYTGFTLSPINSCRCRQ